jgi:ATP-binding cassette subfamily B protein
MVRTRASAIGADEEVLAWLEIDLDASLRFAAGLILVSNKRLLAVVGQRGRASSWPYQPGLRLSRSDHAGVGTLELCAPTRAWRTGTTRLLSTSRPDG